MTADLPPARRPAAPPSPSDLAERDRYAVVTAGALDAVRASAQAWRNGLAAFLTLVTTGIIIKGRDTAANLPTGWRALITLLIGGGLALAIVGLWQALAAEAGTSVRPQVIEDIRASNTTLDAYLLTLAHSAGERLRWGRYTVAGALVCLLAGIILTWWAPARVASPPAYLTVVHGRVTTCGTPRGASRGQLRLSPAGSQSSVTIPLARITSITVTASCP